MKVFASCVLLTTQLFGVTYILFAIEVMFHLVVILCLLQRCLMEVHCQTFPYASFLEKTLPNHAYLNISLVRNRIVQGRSLEDPNDGVKCHTNLSTCCRRDDGEHRGDWFFPNGTKLPFPGPNHTMFESRQNMSVDLRRFVRYYDLQQFHGIYRCDIPTIASSEDMRESIYVGLYDQGGIHMHGINV